MSILDETNQVRAMAKEVILHALGDSKTVDWLDDLVNDLAQAGVLKDPTTERENIRQAKAEVLRDAAREIPDDAAYPSLWLQRRADVGENYYEGG